MDVDLLFARLTISDDTNPNPTIEQRHDVLAQFQYLSSRTLPYDILTYPPGLEQLLMHCRVCHFLTETKGDLHAARTYVLREMKKGLSSPFDDMMLLLGMIDVLMHHRALLSGQQVGDDDDDDDDNGDSAQDWMAVVWRPLLERIILTRQSETGLSFKASGFSSLSLDGGAAEPKGSSVRIRVVRAGRSVDLVALRVLPASHHTTTTTTTKDVVGSKILCEAKAIVDGLTLSLQGTTIGTSAYGIEIEGCTAVIFSMHLVAFRQCYVAWPEHRFTLPATGETVGEFKEAIQALLWLRDKLEEASAHVQAVWAN
ncbi:hypothetical protein BGZ59_011480 [Podila verticillata]|nr:hypothetical protein BGZ59_011480 [Podila verticillata]